MAVTETVNVTGELKKKLVVESEVSIPSGINIENEVSVTSETNIESEVSIPSGINADSDIKINPSGININTGNNTNDHADLNNLDYKNSGHTGFASQIDLDTAFTNIEHMEGSILDLINKHNELGEEIESHKTRLNHLDNDKADKTEVYLKDETYSAEQIDAKLANNSSAKIELKSKIERVGAFGEYRYLVIEFPYSEKIMSEINRGKVKLHLYKQSRKKASESHNPYIKWVVPTASFGVGSEHFIGSFSEEYTVARGGLKIPPVISIEDATSNLLTMENNGTTITLRYNLSELSKAMSFINDDNYNITPSSYIGTTLPDTKLDGNKVIGKRLRNSRVALRYKFRLFFETSQTYSEFTDIVTILYTRITDGLSIGMQIK